MDVFLLNWLLFVGIFVMALMSPGPDFVIAVRNSLLYSRKIGVMTALGFAAGICVHMTYTLFGIAALISQSVILFSLIKYAGAAYLFYIGVQALRSKGFEGDITIKNPHKIRPPMNNGQALWSGFLTNALNPKATIFFMAVFSQFIGADTPFIVQLSYAMTCVIMTGLWFSIVAVILTNPLIKAKFLNFTKWIDRVCGCLLIALGIKLALTKLS